MRLFLWNDVFNRSNDASLRTQGTGTGDRIDDASDHILHAIRTSSIKKEIPSAMEKLWLGRNFLYIGIAGRSLCEPALAAFFTGIVLV